MQNTESEQHAEGLGCAPRQAVPGARLQYEGLKQAAACQEHLAVALGCHKGNSWIWRNDCGSWRHSAPQQQHWCQTDRIDCAGMQRPCIRPGRRPVQLWGHRGAEYDQCTKAVWYPATTCGCADRFGSPAGRSRIRIRSLGSACPDQRQLSCKSHTWPAQTTLRTLPVPLGGHQGGSPVA